jgi:transcriptional regulator with GAF, ATPase, and Fis domain
MNHLIVKKMEGMMLQRTELQPRFLHDLLVLAARPWTQLDGLLEFVLEKALALTASDVGGCLCLFEISAQGLALVASALRGEWADTPANLLSAWRQHPRSPVLLVLHLGQPYSSDDHEHDPAYFPLLAGGRSSLWVPLRDGKRIIGVMHVESSQPSYYRDEHVRQLQGLAVETVLAIHRLLFREQMAQAGAPMDLVGLSPAFIELERQIRLAAAYASGSVLIIGERGSGKELTARAIHYWSDRRNKPFVPVLASAFAESLFPDELFGHEKHSFTGAEKARKGKFLAAKGGTLFLDEVGDLPPAVQAALLRVIQWGEIQPLGRDVPVKVDVRVIAATNQDLAKLIAEGRFREDLYDRLSMFEIRVPPLRERREDTPLLAGYFLRKHCQEVRRPVVLGGLCTACQNVEPVGCATAEFYEALQNYHWPGNVRELEHLIIQLLTTVYDEILDVKHLPEKVLKPPVKAAEPEVEDLSLVAADRKHIERVLQMTGYNQSQAARLLKIHPSTLQSKIKKLGIKIKKR